MKDLASKNLNPHPPSVESAWRLEPGFQTPWYQPRTPTEEVHPPPQATAPESGGTSVGEDVGKTEVVIETKEIPEPKVEVPPDEEKPNHADDDEILIGYSPGSPVQSSAAPPSSGKSNNKFDKYYHQKLGCKIDSELTEYFLINGTNPAPLGMTRINFHMRYNQCLGHQVLQVFFPIISAWNIIDNFLMICHDIRLRRRCDPKVTKKITASKEMLQLYSTPDGRFLSLII